MKESSEQSNDLFTIRPAKVGVSLKKLLDWKAVSVVTDDTSQSRAHSICYLCPAEQEREALEYIQNRNQKLWFRLNNCGCVKGLLTIRRKSNF